MRLASHPDQPRRIDMTPLVDQTGCLPCKTRPAGRDVRPVRSLPQRWMVRKPGTNPDPFKPRILIGGILDPVSRAGFAQEPAYLLPVTVEQWPQDPHASVKQRGRRDARKARRLFRGASGLPHHQRLVLVVARVRCHHRRKTKPFARLRKQTVPGGTGRRLQPRHRLAALPPERFMPDTEPPAAGLDPPRLLCRSGPQSVIHGQCDEFFRAHDRREPGQQTQRIRSAGHGDAKRPVVGQVCMKMSQKLKICGRLCRGVSRKI